MADSTPKSYSTDPALYLYTSLTSGSSHIVTATSRMETILKANRIPFKALDIATDEKARMLWGRRAGKDESGRARKIPGLVQMGLVIGDIVEVEDWNEYGELKQHISIYHEGGTPASAAPTPSGTPSKAPAPQATTKETKPPAAPELPKAPEATSKPVKEATKSVEEPKESHDGAQQGSINLAMRQLGQEAAQKAKEGMRKNLETTETFSGKGEAEAIETEAEKSAMIPPSISVGSSTEKHTIEAPALLQSPTSSAWKNDAQAKPTTVQDSVDEAKSSQSPNSTPGKSKAEHSGQSNTVAPAAVKEGSKDSEGEETSSSEDDDAEDSSDDE